MHITGVRAAQSDVCIKNSVLDHLQNIQQSWLHSSVTDTAIICKVVSLTLL
jgi:hypothetical protein